VRTWEEITIQNPPPKRKTIKAIEDELREIRKPLPLRKM